MNSCSSCQKPKASLECGICLCSVCKSCVQFVAEDRFSFLSQIPSELSHEVYCNSCFDQKVSLEMASYDETLQKARNILVYEKSQSKETRLMKRKTPPIAVQNCDDYDETVLRLAFLAAKAGFNAIIDVHVTSEKVRENSYQTTIFKGTAVPINLNPNHVARDRALWQNPN